MARSGGSISSFHRVLRDAIDDLSNHGYRSQVQVDQWLMMIREAAKKSLMPDYEVERELRRYFGKLYDKIIKKSFMASRFTSSIIAPQMRAELDRRILASADLIKLNKTAQVEKTLKRFQGWISSIPPSGVRKLDKRELISEIVKPVRQASYEQRRVAIDQGHKLVANINEIVAVHGGAIGGIWHDRGEHDHSYDARKAHLARSGKMFLVRDSWAIKNGLIRKGAGQYMDEIERPAELPFCSCFYEYTTSLKEMPQEWLTKKGRVAIGLK